MPQDIRLDGTLLSSSMTNVSTAKSDEALAASIQQLEEILEVVIAQGAKPTDGSSPKGVDDLISQMRHVLLKDPTNFMGVINMIAPEVKRSGVNPNEQFDEILNTFALYQESIKGMSPDEFSRDFEKHLAPSFVYGGEAKKALDGLLEDLKPALEELRKGSPNRSQPFLDKLVPALAKVAFHNSKNVKAVLGTLKENLSMVYGSSDQDQIEHLNNVVNHYVATQPSSVPDGSRGLAEAMMMLQLFQVAVSQSQAEQDTIDAQMAEAAITAAQNNQKNVTTEIQKANEAAEKAAHRPWWETLVQVFVAVVSVVVSVLTAGTGAALVAAAVGMFMATPLFNDSVQAIAKAISAVLVKAYEAEGMSSEDAHMKANAVADLIAKAIVIAVVMAISCGVGGISAVSDSTTSTVIDAASDEVAEEAAQSATESTTKWTNSLKTGAKLAGFEGVSMFVSTGMPLDCMMTNPEWAKNHQKLMEGLNIMATLIGMALAFVGGAKLFSGAGTGTTLIERLPTAFKAFIPLQYLGEGVQGIVEGVLSNQRAGYLNTQASVTKDIGSLEAELGETLTGVDFVTDAQNTNDTSATSIVKGVGETMTAMGENSGAAWKVTSRLLAS